jgi:hypothetical protein
MLAAKIAGLRASLTLLQDLDDLLFTEPAVLHCPLFLSRFLIAPENSSLKWFSFFGQGQTRSLQFAISRVFTGVLQEWRGLLPKERESAQYLNISCGI